MVGFITLDYIIVDGAYANILTFIISGYHKGISHYS